MTILVLPDVLTSEEAAAWRAELEAASWQDGRRTAGDLAATVKSNEQLDDGDPLAVRLSGALLERLGRNERFVSAALPLKVVPPRFNRYTGDGAYGDHVDNAVFTLPGTGERVRSDLSATLFLSEPDSYEGGELVIDHEGGESQVKLAAGEMLLYSARSLHRVTPVTKGARYAAFFWIESMVRTDQQRAMLLQLDQAVQALRTDTPGHPSIDRLVGLYHNLLREWVST